MIFIYRIHHIESTKECDNDTTNDKNSTSIYAGDILLSVLNENGNWMK